MNYPKITLYVILILALLYILQVRLIVEFVDSARDTWNYFVDYVLTFRYRQPLVFLALPFIAIWLMGKK